MNKIRVVRNTILYITVLFFATLIGCNNGENETKQLPADATEIIGEDTGIDFVELSVNEIEHATSYAWYKDGNLIEGAESRTYTATGSGVYKVAGVNKHGEGNASPEKTITIIFSSELLPDAAGNINSDITESTAPILLSIDEIERAETYRWYKDGVEVQNSAEQTYTASERGVYTVAGVNANGEGESSPGKLIQIKFAFTDIPESIAAGSGTPFPGKYQGPTTWTSTVIPHDDDNNYYSIDYWPPTTDAASNKIIVYINHINGQMFIDNVTTLAGTLEDDYRGFFEAFAIIDDTAYILESFSPSYNITTNTINFSAKYQGADVFVGVIAYKTDGAGNYIPKYTGFTFTECYANAKLVLSPNTGHAPQSFSAGSRIQGNRVDANFDATTGLYTIPGIKHIKRVKFN